MGKPIYLKVERVYNHPLEKVWKAVAIDFGHVANYSPAVKASHFDSEAKSGVGTKRHCDFVQKGYVKEEIIDWKDKESFTLTMIESSMPMAVLKSKFHFVEQNGRTKFTQEFWYRMKAPMGWMSGMMKGKMQKVLVGGLEGLEKYLNQ